MYAQLGDVVFTTLNGYSTISDSEEAVIAKHSYLLGKPKVNSYASDAREMSVVVSLHSRFIIVANAIAQLRAYLQNGTVVTLLWGDGTVEGNFLVKSIDRNIDEQFDNGTLIAATLSVKLVETKKSLLDVSQQDAFKAAFAVEGNVASIIYDVPAAPEVPKSPARIAFENFIKGINKAKRYANIINGLLYVGSTYQGKNLSQIIANTRTNINLLQMQYFGSYEAYDVVFNPITAGLVLTSLNSLDSIDAAADPAGMKAANNFYQQTNNLLVAPNWGVVSKEITNTGTNLYKSNKGYVRTTSKPAESWYALSYRAYGSIAHASKIMNSNAGVALDRLVPAGTTMNIPVLEGQKIKTDSNLLPPWKR